MPPGEDPDTLVRRGGTAALEPILRDAIDLLERKIQLLEQKGWFEGVDHQRDALDRLIPTIRAAADPITRDLYLKEVSERSGVSREVLLQQVTRTNGDGGRTDGWSGNRWGSHSRGAGEGSSRQEGGSRRRPERSERAGARRKVDPAERDLLRVLIYDRSWIDRALREVPAEWIETLPFRELYEALLRSPEKVGSPVFLEDLSPFARRAYAWLDRREAKYGRPDPDRTYEGAVGSLQIRALRREWNALVHRMRTQVPADEYDALVQRRKALKAEIALRMPEELVKRQHRGVDPDAR